MVKSPESRWHMTISENLRAVIPRAMAAFFLRPKKATQRNRASHCSVDLRMPNKLQQLRKEQLRGGRTRPRGRRSSYEAMLKGTDKHFYGTLGPASPVKRIDPKTGEVIEILNPQQSNST
jgi:hypothetical protein